MPMVCVLSCGGWRDGYKHTAREHQHVLSQRVAALPPRILERNRSIIIVFLSGCILIWSKFVCVRSRMGKCEAKHVVCVAYILEQANSSASLSSSPNSKSNPHWRPSPYTTILIILRSRWEYMICIYVSVIYEQRCMSMSRPAIVSSTSHTFIYIGIIWYWSLEYSASIMLFMHTDDDMELRWCASVYRIFARYISATYSYFSSCMCVIEWSALYDAVSNRCLIT